jgi:hypothetical protein
MTFFTRHRCPKMCIYGIGRKIIFKRALKDLHPAITVFFDVQRGLPRCTPLVREDYVENKLHQPVVLRNRVEQMKNVCVHLPIDTSFANHDHEHRHGHCHVSVTAATAIHASPTRIMNCGPHRLHSLRIYALRRFSCAVIFFTAPGSLTMYVHVARGWCRTVTRKCF